MKEPSIQIIKDDIQVVDPAPRRGDVFTSSQLPDQVRLFRHMMGRDISAITGGVRTIQRLAVYLGKQDMGNGAKHVLGCTFEQVGNSHQQLAFTEADRVVHIGKAEELDAQFGER